MKSFLLGLLFLVFAPAVALAAFASATFTVTIAAPVQGTCGVGTFANSSCPPLPTGTTQWVYLGGSEFDTFPDIVNDPHWRGSGPPGNHDNGISCAFYANSFVSGGVLHEIGGQPADCAVQPAYPCDARITGAHCVGPQFGFCLAGSDPACGVNIDPGGLYIEARLMGNAPYWSWWLEAEHNPCNCQSITICGLETDVTENYGGGDGTNYNYGGYSGGPCEGVTNAPASGINLADGSFHILGTTIISGDGVRQYRDGHFVSLFNNPSTLPYGSGPPDLGVAYLLLSGIEGNNGEVDYDWIRFYRAQ